MTFNVPMGLLRSVSNSFLTDTCTIKRKTAGTATGDGTPLTETTVASDVPCAVTARRALARESLGQRGGPISVGDWRIDLPAGQDVTELDVIEVNGRRFEVAGPPSGGTVEPTRSVLCVEVK